MAPNLSSKSNKISRKNKTEKSIKKQLLDFRKYIEKNCTNVGENFSREARSIHYDKKTSKGIYGKTTPEEASELILNGFRLKTDTKVFRWPDRYFDERGSGMWKKIMKLLQ